MSPWCVRGLARLPILQFSLPGSVLTVFKRFVLIRKLLRSPFMKCKVLRWMDEKREIMCDDCDPEVLTVVVEYMYGIDLPPDLGDLSNVSR